MDIKNIIKAWALQRSVPIQKLSPMKIVLANTGGDISRVATNKECFNIWHTHEK
jgi:hypothetical protein